MVIRHRYRIRRDWHLYADAFAQGRSLGGDRCREHRAKTEANYSAHRSLHYEYRTSTRAIPEVSVAWHRGRRETSAGGGDAAPSSAARPNYA
jgi:hypothetical protein